MLELNEQGIAHGNLSLENMFEDNDGNWWLGDFCRNAHVTMASDILNLAAIFARRFDNFLVTIVLEREPYTSN